MARSPSATPNNKGAVEKLAKPSSARGDLSRYREMRDFSKTPEPSGTVKPSAEKLRFVIQKHAARRLHYDLRLELGGVYKSWAVTRGPSLDPHEKRLAVHVEDHPIDYGDFEGIIPKGEYGGGTVMIWDRGYWYPEGDPVKGYEKGHLAFELEGQKLKGRWHLIRIRGRPGDKKEQWLLFKSDDEYAHPGLEGDILEERPESVATHRSLDEIGEEKEAVWSSQGGLVEGALSPAATDNNKGPSNPKKKPVSRDAATRKKASPLLSKDDRKTSSAAPGIDVSKLPGAKKTDFPEFIEPCLALLVEKPPDGDTWLHEIKFDGYRLMAQINGGSVRLLTRKGLDWTTRFPAIAEVLENLAAGTAILDGEAVVEDANGISSFSALQDALSNNQPATNAILFAFDLLYLDGYDLRSATLDDRKNALSELLTSSQHPSLRFSDHVIGNGGAMLENACRLGLEGIVSKRRNSPYRSGRHGEWLKSKCTNREEFVIGGYVPSTATRNAIGSLALGYYDGGKLIHVGRTGTGFTQKSARELFQKLQDLRTSKNPFANALSSEERRGVIFVQPKLVAEVEFRGWTHDRHLRQAAFKGLREDKPAEEVQLEIPQDKAPAPTAKDKGAMPARRSVSAPVKTAKGGAVEFAGVKLTHPDRILWEEQGLTKLGLAEYYAGVADWILPHIVKRPLALVRCPNGSSGECFFQKHSFAGLTEAVEVAHVPDKNGMEEVLVIHDLRGLINLVQANVLEIHPWGASMEDVDRPDIMIFDLDPGEGVEWTAVIQAAKEIRQRLRDTGIESYVKTTGGKGLHVVSPIRPEVGWDELKDFAHRIALAMEADAPSKYISTMAKKARGGKIFVDYLRNGRGATAVAAYSTRARAGAPVSAPVRWEELGPELTAARFNTSNIMRRLSALKSDPWEGFFSSPQPISAAIAASSSRQPSRKRREAITR